MFFTYKNFMVFQFYLQKKFLHLEIDPDRVSMKSEIGKYVGYVGKHTHRMIELKKRSLLLTYVRVSLFLLVSNF